MHALLSKIKYLFSELENDFYASISEKISSRPHSFILGVFFPFIYTVDSRYLEVEGTFWNTSRYPYFDISEVQNWGKYQSNNQISQMNM